MAASDYSPTAASNTTIGGIAISGTDLVSLGDNVMRQIAADIKNGVITGYTTTATAAGTTTLTVSSNSYQYFTGTTTQTITMPVTSTLELGRTWVIVNNSTGALTVNSSGGNLIVTVASGQRATVRCILLTGTSAASWSYDTPNLLTSTDAGATAGPVLEFYRNSASPAASDILGNITFNGEDSAGNTQEYASVETVIIDATSTSEDGQLDFYVTKAGTRTKFASMTATATAFTGAAAYSMDAPLTVSSTAAGTVATFTSTDAGATAGPVLDLHRNSASPAASDDLGQITWNGKDDAGNKQEYANVMARISDPASGSEDGALLLRAFKAGATTNYLFCGLDAAGTATPDAVGLPRGNLSFPANQNASSDANTLDDYEETTWTPVVTFATAGDLSVAYTTQLGFATKIGRFVKAIQNIVTSTFTHSSASGSLQTTGYPYTSANVTGNTAFGTGQIRGYTKANFTMIASRVAANLTLADFVASGSAQSPTTLTTGDVPTGGTVNLIFTTSYAST